MREATGEATADRAQGAKVAATKPRRESESSPATENRECASRRRHRRGLHPRAFLAEPPSQRHHLIKPEMRGAGSVVASCNWTDQPVSAGRAGSPRKTSKAEKSGSASTCKRSIYIREKNCARITACAEKERKSGPSGAEDDKAVKSVVETDGFLPTIGNEPVPLLAASTSRNKRVDDG